MIFKSLLSYDKLKTHNVEFKTNIAIYTRKAPDHTLRATLKIAHLDGDDILNNTLNSGHKRMDEFIRCCAVIAQKKGAKGVLYVNDVVIMVTSPPDLQTDDSRGINSWYNVLVTGYQRIEINPFNI